MKLNLKNKLLLLRTKVFIYLWTRSLSKTALLEKWDTLYRTYILSLVCQVKTHIWSTPKVEWIGPKSGKHRTCSRCLKSEKYENIFSNKIA